MIFSWFIQFFKQIFRIQGYNQYHALSLSQESFNKIFEYFSSPLHITLPKKLKNLLFISFESFETNTLGIFNKKCPESMSFLSRMINNSIYTLKTKVTQHACYSVGAMHVGECNFPIIGVNEYNSALVSFPKCIGNIMKSAGYKLDAFFANSGEIHNKNELFLNHNYTLHNTNTNSYMSDSDVFEDIQNNYLPLLKEQRNGPHVLYIEICNTHMSGNLDKKCVSRLPRECPTILDNYDCDDQLLEKFFKKFDELNLSDNTEVFIVGDHLNMRLNLDFSLGPRQIQMIIPYHSKKAIQRLATQYDVAPTILDLLDIDVQPKFIFGSSFLKDETNILIPDINELNMLFQMIRSTKAFSKVMSNCSSCVNLTGITNSGLRDYASTFFDQVGQF